MHEVHSLGRFASTQAGPKNTPLAGVTLEEESTSIAASAAPGSASPFWGGALIALRYLALAGVGPGQAPPRRPPLAGGALER